MTNDPITDFCTGMRGKIKKNGEDIKQFKKELNGIEAINCEDRGEVIANLTLAYRHIEDSVMRLGKVIQAEDGGVSGYDK